MGKKVWGGDTGVRCIIIHPVNSFIGRADSHDGFGNYDPLLTLTIKMGDY